MTTVTRRAHTAATIAQRHSLAPDLLLRLLGDRTWCERWRITPTGMHCGRPAYDAAMSARVVAAYRADKGGHCVRSGQVKVSREGWRCLHCGGTTRERHCLSCDLTIGRGWDLRQVRMREMMSCDHLVGRDTGSRGNLYGPEHDRIEALRGEPLEDQFDFLRRMIADNMDRRELEVDRAHRLVPRLRRLGWDGELPWEAVALLLRRTCPRCGSAVIGLDYIVRQGGRIGLSILSRLVVCSPHCERTGPLPDGWQDRLAEVRARKQAAGEMA